MLPSVSVGLIKSLSKYCYAYWGGGYSPFYHFRPVKIYEEYYEIPHRKIGGIAELGIILRRGNLDFSFGGAMLLAENSSVCGQVQLGLGYVF